MKSIDKFSLNNNKINLKGNKMEKTLFQAEKEAVKQMYDIVRRDVPSDSEFSEIHHRFEDPKTNETYILTVAPSYNDKNPDEKSLQLAYLNKETSYKRMLNLLWGSKQDILDYLGNEKNLDEISIYMKSLKVKAEEED